MVIKHLNNLKCNNITMRRLIIIGLVISLTCLFIMGRVYSYACFNVEDNDGVKEFKQKINLISLKQDIDSGLTHEAIYYKLKYFGPCR